MTKLLTVRKQKWAGVFKPKMIRGTPLNPNVTAIDRYYAALRRLILKMSITTERDFRALFQTEPAQEYFAADASVSSQARILMNELMRKFENIFDLESKKLAADMVGEAEEDSARALQMSLKQLSGGLTLKTDVLTGELNEVITASVNENVGLIRSIASQYLDQISGAVMRSITTGQGLADLVPAIKAQEGITLRRARLIANDQTRKAFNNINKHRLQALGMDDFEWLHTAGSQHPRKYHIEMSGKIYSLSNPPVIDPKTGERGIPGQLIYCRCRMIPVIKFNEGVPDVDR